MKTYSNHKFNLVEDDDIVSSANTTDLVCIILTMICILLIAGLIVFSINTAKAEAKAYRAEMEQGLCNLMEFSGSTYHCEDNDA